jgi:phasin
MRNLTRILEMQMAEPKARAPKPVAIEAQRTASEEIHAAKDFTSAAFSYPTFEVPEFFRSLAEQSLNQTRDAYARMKTAAEDATDILEDSIESARGTVRDAQFKALDLAKANADATFELARKLLTTTSVGDAVQLQTTFARERFEALVDYSKDVQAIVSKVSADASKPARAIFDKAIGAAKAA